MNRVRRRIRHLNSLDLPDFLAVRYDRLVTAQVTAFAQGGYRAAAEFIGIREDIINLLLRLAIWVKISLNLRLVVRRVDFSDEVGEGLADLAELFAFN